MKLIIKNQNNETVEPILELWLEEDGDMVRLVSRRVDSICKLTELIIYPDGAVGICSHGNLKVRKDL